MPFSQSSGGAVTGVIGNPTLIYRFTVSGSVKASIDTGVDATQAGSGDFTNGDLLEVFFYGRTDEAVIASSVNISFNNDSGANYDYVRTQNSAGTLTGATAAGTTSLGSVAAALNVTGASAAASHFGQFGLVIPNYGGTVGFKNGTAWEGAVDNPAGTTAFQQGYAFTYRSTTAITRLKVIPTTAAKNFAIGSQLLIYKRANA